MKKIVDGKMVTVIDSEIQSIKESRDENEIISDTLIKKQKKSQEILSIATISDQLNKMATEIYKLTKDSIDPETIENRKILKEIQTILKR